VDSLNTNVPVSTKPGQLQTAVDSSLMEAPFAGLSGLGSGHAGGSRGTPVIGARVHSRVRATNASTSASTNAAPGSACCGRSPSGTGSSRSSTPSTLGVCQDSAAGEKQRGKEGEVFLHK
jgi:hypothetical protein